MLSVSFVHAQDETPAPPPTVPDVTGMTLPTATALLNQMGIAVNAQQTYNWTDSDTISPYTITTQNPQVGAEVPDGLVATLTIARPVTARLFYDDNDLTLINLSDGELTLRNIVFTAIDGNPPASFSASEWTVDTVSPQRCVQIWAVAGRQGAKDVEGCQSARDIPWLTRGNAPDHFWLDDNGATGFTVTQDGVWRGDCTIIPNTTDVQTCDLYLMPAGLDTVAQDVTEYVYFRYTPEQLWVINRADDRWMPTSQVDIVDGIDLADYSLYRESSPVTDIDLLAPNQCLLITTSDDALISTPESCDLIGIAEVDDNFWQNGFEINSRMMPQTFACLPSESDEMTVCLVPR